MKYVVPKKLWSGSFIPNWLLEKPNVSANAKLLYARLSQFSTDSGVAFPKQEIIGNECGMGIRTVSRGLYELQKLNLIEKRQVGLNQPNQYRFPYHEWMTTETSEVNKPVDNKDTHNDTEETDRRTRLPKDFQLSSDTKEWSIKQAGAEKTEEELERFKDYWWSKSGTRATKLDWNLAFKNWIRNDAKWNSKNNFKRGDQARTQRQTAIATALDRRMGTLQ